MVRLFLNLSTSLFNNMIVIGVCGTIGAGKDVISYYLKENYGFVVLSMSDLARVIARREHRSSSRRVLQSIAEERFKEYGRYYFIDLLIDKIRKYGYKRIVINGVRGFWEVERARKVFGRNYYLLFVDAPRDVRFKRLKKRRRTGFSKTLAGFSSEEERDYSIFDERRTFKMADSILINDSALNELYNAIDFFVKPLLEYTH